jgi:pimeloyl-ACP methyl ester carboxylesterase
MLTSSVSEDERSSIVDLNLKFPREYAARLLYDLATEDWRDTIPRIDIPTLIVSGRASTVPWTSQVWIHEQIKGSRLEIFEEGERGGHFMFSENPDKFNQVVGEFIGQQRRLRGVLG